MGINPNQQPRYNSRLNDYRVNILMIEDRDIV